MGRPVTELYLNENFFTQETILLLYLFSFLIGYTIAIQVTAKLELHMWFIKVVEIDQTNHENNSSLS